MCFWRYRKGKKSVLAWREWQKKCFGVVGAAKKVFWRGVSGKNSVLVWRELQVKCFGMAGVARKVFWHGGSDDSAPFSGDKIRAKILDLGYGGARRAL